MNKLRVAILSGVIGITGAGWKYLTKPNELTPEEEQAQLLLEISKDPAFVNYIANGYGHLVEAKPPVYKYGDYWLPLVFEASDPDPTIIGNCTVLVQTDFDVTRIVRTMPYECPRKKPERAKIDLTRNEIVEYRKHLNSQGYDLNEYGDTVKMTAVEEEQRNMESQDLSTISTADYEPGGKYYEPQGE